MEHEQRKEQILRYVCRDGEGNADLYGPVIAEMVYLEKKLEELKKLPFIEVHPQNPARQRSTPAAKQYKEFLQQYNNIMKTLARAAGEDGEEKESPLRKWVREHESNDR